jgi:hypothetical protein
MKRLYTFTTVCALGMALSGCVQSPTAAEGHTVESGNASGARFNLGAASGGGTYGSGGKTTSEEAPSGTSSAATVSSGAETAADTSGVVERGGHTFGSGN